MAVERIDTEIDLSRDRKAEKEERDKLRAMNGSMPPEDEGDDLEVEVVDDTPEGDRGRKPRKEGTKSAIPEDDEIGQYTKGVQDRMKQMKWEFHEERRAREAWERQHNAAVDFAKKVYGENQKLRELVTKGHKTMIDSTKASAESEMKALQTSLKQAMETGDSALAAELQGKLASAAARAEAQNHIQPIGFPEEPAPAERQEQQQERRQVRLTEPMQNWMDDNPWFNTNKRMTAFAFGVHEELMEKGVPPESPRYFSEINKAVKDAFPQYYADDENDRQDEPNDRGTRANGRTAANGRAPNRRSTNVAGVGRTSARGSSDKVQLTLSEAAVAKKMGVSIEAYAREKKRLMESDNG